MAANRNRFDLYESEIWGCFCPLCMALASAALRGGAAWQGPSDALYAALTSGTHRKQAPRVSLSKVRTYRPQMAADVRALFREGTGIGVTTRQHQGAVR
ncbi:hypothetical protein [Streptomyces sp. URMC 129]|uniref:hypothetical protein n=1 Tax=Streptomyces sp. URMC 129 TaxID=3423407 RepID=UPI003F1B04D4